MASNAGLLTDSLLVLRHANAAQSATGSTAERVPLPVQVGAGLVIAVWGIQLGVAGFPPADDSQYNVWVHRSDVIDSAQTAVQGLSDNDAVQFATFKSQLTTSGATGAITPQYTPLMQPLLIFQDMSLRFAIDINTGTPAVTAYMSLFYRVKKVSDAELGRLALLSA